MDELTHRSMKRIITSITSTVLVVLVLSGCGIGDDNGDENGEPTATTVAGVSSPADLTEPETEEAIPTLADASPTEIDAGTPEPAGATPTPGIVVSAPPITIPTMPPEETTTPSAPVEETPTSPPAEAAVDADSSVGDGTSGANVAGDIDQSATPAPAASGDVAVVASCDVESYEPYQGDAGEQVTAIDTNLWSGPGVDCETVGEPLAAGAIVEILSEPVTREGSEDNFSWVAVSVGGTEGWIATVLLEPLTSD